jgi:hypothetical protein
VNSDRFKGHVFSLLDGTTLLKTGAVIARIKRNFKIFITLLLTPHSLTEECTMTNICLTNKVPWGSTGRITEESSW